jgi:hypothetical protein
MPTQGNGPKGKGQTYKKGSGTLALTHIKIALFKDNYPEDKLTDDDEDHIRVKLGWMFRGTLKGELPRLGREVLSCLCALMNSLTNGSLEPLTITGWNQG